MEEGKLSWTRWTGNGSRVVLTKSCRRKAAGMQTQGRQVMVIVFPVFFFFFFFKVLDEILGRVYRTEGT